MDEKARKELEDQGVVFYYDREERLKKQPKLAPLYDGSLRLPRGFFASLRNAPGGKFLISAIVLLLVLVLFLSVFDKRNEDTLNGVSFSLSAFSFDDTVYVTVKCDAQTESAAAKRGESGKEKDSALKTETGAPQNDAPNTLRASMQTVNVLFTAEDASKTVIDKQTVSDVYTGAQLLVRTTFTDYDITKIVATVTIDDKEKTVSAAVSR